MDENALMKLTYGLYVLGVRDKQNNRFAGCIVDAVMQTTCTPLAIVVSCRKQNYTTRCIQEEKRFSLSVLPEDAPCALLASFGFKSSEQTDKWAFVKHSFMDELPVITDNSACMTARVTHISDLGTHLLFFADIESATDGDKIPLSYEYYRQNKRGDTVNALKKGLQACAIETTQKENKMENKKEEKWICTVCGYVYDGEIPFEELPDDYVCPICGVPKSDFVKEEE